MRVSKGFAPSAVVTTEDLQGPQRLRTEAPKLFERQSCNVSSAVNLKLLHGTATFFCVLLVDGLWQVCQSSSCL